MSETGDLITRIYSGFRGVDFRGDEINIVRSPDSLNVWKDYADLEKAQARPGDTIRTRPGMRKLLDGSSAVTGIHFYNGELIAHMGNALYRVEGDGLIKIADVAYGGGRSFVFNGTWYFMDGEHYYQYNGTTCKDVVPYVPTTTIGRAPLGGGTVYQDVNLLNVRKRKNSFVADGTAEYFLDVPYVKSIDRVTVNGEVVSPSDYTMLIEDSNKYRGSLEFINNIPQPPMTDGQDNVVIEFTVADDGEPVDQHREMILKCKLLQLFDNRVFVSGNDEYPNTLWHCALQDPSYFSDTDRYTDGVDSAKITGLVAGNNALWVFREPSEANTSIFYHTPTIDGELGKVYPYQHSSISTGCVGEAINFNDDIVFFSERGMEGMSGDITTEQAVAHRSSLVDRKLMALSGYKNMILAEWQGYLVVFIGKEAFLADSRAVFANENHTEYEWFYWQMEKEITCATVYGGKLYLGADDGVYTLDDMTAALESYWVTPKDKFKASNRLKTTNKRGCVVEATGDITVYAKTEDTGFEEIGKYTGVTDYFVSRIKRKKFKDIQLKFHSYTRFSLETATLECFIGGYIKR